MCGFFKAPGNGPSLLGMPNNEKLDALTVDCHTVDTLV